MTIEELRAKRREYQRRYVAANADKVRESQAKWRAEHPGYDIERRKAFFAAHPERRKLYRSNFRQRFRQKYLAHKMVENALLGGRLTKPDFCSSCSASVRLEGHHPDYSKPLEVVWLCRQCHERLHREAK